MHPQQKTCDKTKHFVDFMQKMFVRDHAEPAPPLKEGEECWYLPCSGVHRSDWSLAQVLNMKVFHSAIYLLPGLI